MTEYKNAMLPDIADTAPRMQYDDLKLPLLQRGIPIPAAMEDYIKALVARDMLTDAELETIRKEMLDIFRDAGINVPSDFETHFTTWFRPGQR